MIVSMIFITKTIIHGGKDHVAKVYQLSLWKKLDKVPDDIKLLCANCHRIRNEHGEN
jgi:hypothetical protein